MKLQFNKKVLLRERKRHTARCVANTPYVVLTGYPPRGGVFRVPPRGSGYPPGGYPVRYPPGGSEYPPRGGTWSGTQGGSGYPPGGVPSQVPWGGLGTPGGVPGQVPGGYPVRSPPGGGYPDTPLPSPLWTDKHL